MKKLVLFLMLMFVVSSGSAKVSNKKPIFVIQQHKASHMHYDFRLEIDGVLTSWAVPKGPSTDPAQKRLAMFTEDHPLKYATFEGLIPEGNYGAGTVMVWDTGTYKNIKTHNGKAVSMEQCLKNGQLEFELMGKKLKGAYALIHAKLKDPDAWLLIKMDDAHVHKPKDPVKTMTKSVLTGRSMREIAAESDSPSEPKVKRRIKK